MTEKTASELEPGDIVTPTRGIYEGVQCLVGRVEPGRYGTYQIIVTPLTRHQGTWSVDWQERIKVGE